MGHIHHHAQPLHLGQKRRALFRHTLVGDGGAGPHIVHIAGHAVGVGQPVGVVPGQRHHPHAQTVQRAQHRRVVQTDAALLHRQHGADSAAAGQRPDVLRCAHPHEAGKLRQQLLVNVDFLQTRLQGIQRLLAQIHKAGKALQQIIPPRQFVHVHHQIAAGKVLGMAPADGVAQLGQRVTVQVPNLHCATSKPGTPVMPMPGVSFMRMVPSLYSGPPV